MQGKEHLVLDLLEFSVRLIVTLNLIDYYLSRILLRLPVEIADVDQDTATRSELVELEFDAPTRVALFVVLEVVVRLLPAIQIKVSWDRLLQGDDAIQVFVQL
jgi:hypothetical protein